MTFPSFRTAPLGSSLCLALAVVAIALAGATAEAQCTSCAQPVYAQPTVAYSPVVAQSPAVYQTYRPYSGWYPGKYLGRALSWPFRATGAALSTPLNPAPTSTFVTAAYRPSYPVNYSVGYAGNAPVYQTVARPIALAAATTCPTCVSNPCCCTSYRPVTLTALSSCCPDTCCNTGCATCASGGCCGGSGVVTAGYDAPYNPGCSDCSGHLHQNVPHQQSDFGNQGSTFNNGSMSAPNIPNNADVPEQRVQRPPFNGGANGNGGVNGNGAPHAAGGADAHEGSVLDNTPKYPADPAEASGEGDDTTSWWGTPPYFDTQDRSARRRAPKGPTAPVWNAVYRKQAGASIQRTAHRRAVQPAPRPQRHKQVGASGWRSAD